jgi:hypothetical protein
MRKLAAPPVDRTDDGKRRKPLAIRALSHPERRRLEHAVERDGVLDKWC